MFSRLSIGRRNTVGIMAIDLHRFGNYHYQYGGVQSGIDTIRNTLTFANECGSTIIATTFNNGEPARFIEKLVPRNRIVNKGCEYNAFANAYFRSLVESSRCNSWLLLGFNRDCCVYHTCMGGVEKGLTLHTSLRLMLSLPPHRYSKLELTEKYYRENTIYHPDIDDVHQLISDGKQSFLFRT